MPHFHPLRSWFPDLTGPLSPPAALHQVVPPRDEDWRRILPGYEACVAFTQMGLPFHAVVEGSHDEEPRHERIPEYLQEGQSLILLQPHEVMPRLMRLIVALRNAFFSPFSSESSYLFMTEGKGEPGMKLHHDGETHSFWLQLEGRRTVTLCGQAPAGSDPEDPGVEADAEATTLQLEPGSLFYMAPRVLHHVVCHERSLAVSLTWEQLPGEEVLGAWLEAAVEDEPDAFAEISTARDPEEMARHVETALRSRSRPSAVNTEVSHRLFAASQTQWYAVPGKPVKALPGVAQGIELPEADRKLYWAQRPAAIQQASSSAILVADEQSIELNDGAEAEALREFPFLPCWRAEELQCLAPGLLSALLEDGLLAHRDLPQLIYPDDVDELAGWEFQRWGG